MATGLPPSPRGNRWLLGLVPLLVTLGILFRGWEGDATPSLPPEPLTALTTLRIRVIPSVESTPTIVPVRSTLSVTTTKQATITVVGGMEPLTGRRGVLSHAPHRTGSPGCAADEQLSFRCTLNWSSYIALPRSEKDKALLWVPRPRRIEKAGRNPTPTLFTSATVHLQRRAGKEEEQLREPKRSSSRDFSDPACYSTDRNDPTTLQLATREIFHRTSVVRFFGDSTLREVVQTLLRFVGNDKLLEKKDTNATFRTPFLFRGDLPRNWPQLAPTKAATREQFSTSRSSSSYAFTFRFDSEVRQLLEPLALPPLIKGGQVQSTGRGGGDPSVIDVISLGVHHAHHELVDLNKTLDEALRSIPGYLDEPLDRYLQRRFWEIPDSDTKHGAVHPSEQPAAATLALSSPSSKVYFLLQELECDQMVRAKVKEFNKKAKKCPDMQRFLEVFNAKLLSRISDLRKSPRFTAHVFVLNPLGCLELRPLGRSCSSHQSACACSKDGIHLRSRYLKAKVEGLLFALQAGLEVGHGRNC